MNQTKKRLSIINLAISITDIETIQLQILKLSILRSDKKIQEIIAGLQAENYAQTQALITTYIETPMEEILQRSSQDEDIQKKKEQAIIEEFDLFIDEPEKQEEPIQEIDNLDSFIDPIPEAKKLSTEQINYDSLLSVEADDILPDNIELDISHTPKDTFFDSTENTTTNTSIDEIFTQSMPKDTFFDNTEEASTEEREEIIEEEVAEKEVAGEEVAGEEIIVESNADIDLSADSQALPLPYEAISYIDQKFNNMYIQYPPKDTSDESFTSVDTWLHKISNDGYSEEDIEEIIKHIDQLSINNRAEAAELLLVTAATESKYAKFRLARALYKGELLKKNISEAFTLINRLAIDDDYPEAICDLAQFYEYGIGTDTDQTKAKLFYKDAMDAGIQRAKQHYDRLNKEEGGFFTFFKKK